MEGNSSCTVTFEVFQRVINILILALGNILIILGEGCITYVKDQGVDIGSITRDIVSNT